MNLTAVEHLSREWVDAIGKLWVNQFDVLGAHHLSQQILIGIKVQRRDGSLRPKPRIHNGRFVFIFAQCAVERGTNVFSGRKSHKPAVCHKTFVSEHDRVCVCVVALTLSKLRNLFKQLRLRQISNFVAVSLNVFLNKISHCHQLLAPALLQVVFSNFNGNSSESCTFLFSQQKQYRRERSSAACFLCVLFFFLFCCAFK